MPIGARLAIRSVRSKLKPSDFVTTAAAKVESCGFSLVSGVANEPTVRIANPLIERNLWGKVSVNALNITTNATDPSVVCIHDIA